MSSDFDPQSFLDDELKMLLAAHCAGALDQEQADRLSARLLGNQTLQLAALCYIDLHSEMMWGRRGVRASLDTADAMYICAVLDDEAESEAARPKPIPRIPFTDPEPRSAAWWTWPAKLIKRLRDRLAAVDAAIQRRWLLLVSMPAALIVVMAVIHSQTPPIPDEPDDVAPPLAALVSRAQTPDQDGDEQAFRQGKPLVSGDYTLERGVVELTLASGPRVIIEAPATFTLTEQPTMALAEGVISVNADGAANDFTVQTPFGALVDIGTAFGVRVDTQAGLDFSVFEGRVRASSLQADANEPVEWIEFSAQTVGRIEAGRAQVVTRSVAEGQEAEGFVRNWQDVTHRPLMSADIVYVPNKAESFVRPLGHNQGKTYLYREALGHELGVDLVVSRLIPGVTQTGGYGPLKPLEHTLPKGTRVNSFLLLAWGPRTGHGERRFTLTFPEPILGVIATRPSLQASNKVFEVGNVNNEAFNDVFDQGIEDHDLIKLGDGGRTLVLDLKFMGLGDVLRIITAPKDVRSGHAQSAISQADR